MIDARQRLLHRADRGQGSFGRAFDEDDRNVQFSGRRDLAVGGAAAAVLGDDAVDAMRDQQGMLIRFAERPCRKDVTDIRQGQGRLDGIDAAHEIGMLRRAFEQRRFLPTDGQENTARHIAQRRDGFVHARNAGPEVARLALPGRAAKGEGGDAGFEGCLGGIVRNTGREGVCGIDEKIEAFGSQRPRKTIGAAKAADAGGHGLRHRCAGAAGERKHHAMRCFCQGIGQRAGFRGAAENEDMMAHA